MLDITESSVKVQLTELKNLALEKATFGMTISDSKGDFVYVNPQAARLMGYKSEVDLLHKNWRILYSAEEIAFYEKEVLPLLIEDNSWDGVVTMKKRKSFSIRAQISLKHLADGFFLCIFYDVTDKEKDKLKLSDLSAAVASTMDGIALLNSEGVYYYLNQQHVAVFGYDKEDELLGKTWRAIYEPAEIKRIEEDIFPELIKNGRWQGETTGIKKDGTHVQQEISLTTLAHGGLICITRNINEKKGHLNEIKKLALIANKTSNAILITNSEHELEWYNKSTEKIFIPREQTNKQDIFAFLRNAGIDEQGIDKVRLGWNTNEVFNEEFNFVNRNGKDISLYANISPVHENGEVTNFIYIMTDISAIKSATESILHSLENEKQLNEMKSRFVSLASHEFRTPITSIQSSIEILQLHLNSATGLSKPKLQSHLNQISDEVKNMTELLDNVLVLEKIKNGKFDFKLTQTDIIDNINAILKNHQLTLHSKRIKLTIKGTIRTVCCDVRLLEHILNNLVGNALKYSNNTTKPVELILSFKKEEVQFSVKDYGIGIPAQDQPRLFESFFRASNTINIAGTGLGLTIARQFIEVHGGKIQFKSKENFGSVFSFNIKG